MGFDGGTLGTGDLEEMWLGPDVEAKWLGPGDAGGRRLGPGKLEARELGPGAGDASKLGPGAVEDPEIDLCPVRPFDELDDDETDNEDIADVEALGSFETLGTCGSGVPELRHSINAAYWSVDGSWLMVLWIVGTGTSLERDSSVMLVGNGYEEAINMFS